jgi:ParB/RepB/Spo0J family partition protein
MADTEQVIRVRLNYVDASRSETARTGDFTQSERFRELVESIRRFGQRMPAIIRPISGKREYRLVTGYRRYAALRLIEIQDAVPQSIWAIVRELDDREAMIENMLDCSEGLYAADLAVALYIISERSPEAKDSDLAQMVGISQSYANTLLRICRAAPKEALQWQAAQYPLTVRQMEVIAKVKDPEKRAAQYEVTARAVLDRARS